jgi:gliding motility-associated-like protein
MDACPKLTSITDMIKNLILLISVILFFVTDVKAQTPKDNACEAEVFCSTVALDNFADKIRLPLKAKYLIPRGFCGQSVEGPSWFRFIAETPILDLRFNYSSCGSAGQTGFQAAIFSSTDCSDSTAFALKSNCLNLGNATTTGTLNATGLVNGQTYYIFIDGLSGSQCDYNIDVLTGTIQTVGLSNLGAPTVIYGPTEICNASNSAVFSVPKNPSASAYNLTVEINGGPPLGGIQLDSFYKVLAAFTPVGIARVTANYVNNCTSGPTKTLDVIIGNSTVIQLPPLNLKFGESIAKYDSVFNYGPTLLTTTSTQNISFAREDLTFSGCDTTYKLTINRIGVPAAGKAYFLRPNESIILGGTTYTVTAGVCTPIITSGNDTIYNAIQTYTVSPASPVTLNCNSTFFSVGKKDSCANTLHYKTYNWTTIENGIFSSLGLPANTKGQGFNSVLFDSIGIIIKDSVLVNGKPESGYKIYFDTLKIQIKGIGSVDKPQKPLSINGLTTTCQNNTVTYKLPAKTPLATSYTWSLLRGGGTFVSPQGDTAITVKWGSLTKKDTLRVVASNVCFSSQPTDLIINVGTFPNLTAGVDDSICGSMISLKGVSGGNLGNWTSVVGNPSIPSFQVSATPTTSVTVSTSGTYKFAWTETTGTCSLSDTVAIIFNPMPFVAIGSLKDSCNTIRTQAYVRFNIASGTAPFQVLNSVTNVVAGTVSAGGQFQSNAFTPGNYSFKIQDAKNCTPALVTGTQACSTCNTNAGAMQAGSFSICEGDSVKATYLNGSTLEPDDTLQFVLHTGDPKTGIVARSFKPNFAFQLGMTYGITYFISAIAGNKIGNAVDINDGCFSTTTPKIVSVIFNKKPFAAMTVVDSNLCLGSCANISLAFNGQAPFTITGKISNPTPKDTIITTSLTSYNFRYCPKENTAFRLFSVRDASGCVDSVAVNKTVNFTLFTPVNAGLDTVLTVCQGIDTLLNLNSLLRGGGPGGVWSEISATPSVGNAFSTSANTFRTRNQGNRVYKFQYILRPTVITSPCPADTMVLLVNIQFTPVADAGIDDLITCARPIVLIGGNTQLGTGITLQWSSSANNLGGNAPQQEVSQAASYVLTASAGGCFSRDTVVIRADTASPKAIISPVSDSITCKANKDVLALDGSQSSPTGIVYTWSYNGAPYDNSSKSVARFGGTYMLMVQKLSNGCSNIDSIKIRENRILPTIVIQPTPKLTCKDSIITLDATASSTGAAYSIQWKSTQRGHFKSDSTTYLPKVDSAGIYILTITDSRNGCKDSLQRTIIGEFNVPTAEAFTMDTLDCYHPTVNLSARGSSLGVGLSYRWIANPGFIVSGEKSLSAVVSEPGKYYFIATNDKTECSAIDSVVVFKNSNRPQNIALTTNKPTCYGEQNGSLVINGITGGTSPYLYSLDGKVYTPRKSFTNLNAGAYKLYVQDASGCIVDTSFNIVQDRQIGVSIGLDTLLKLGDSLLLQVGVNIPNVKRVVWSSYSDSTCRRDSACMQQWVKPTRQTTYNVQVRDANGCMAEGAINVSINKNRPVFIPDIFSPNNDGTNDVFMIFGSKVVKIVKRFQVYDRWGELIVSHADFVTDNPQFGWDGTIGGKQAVPGVYSYYVEIEYLDGQADIIKGDVTLMR